MAPRSTCTLFLMVVRNSAKADGFERQSHGQRTRQRIIDAAIELFASTGYRGTGVAALAERVRMTAPGMLYYFGSKERLLHEVMAERDRIDQIQIRSMLRLGDVRRAGAHTLTNRILVQLSAVLSAEAIEADQPLHKFFVARNRRDRAFARGILEAEIIEGRARADIDIDQLAVELASFTIGLELQWLTDPDAVDIVGATERYVDELIRRIAIPIRQEPHAD